VPTHTKDGRRAAIHIHSRSLRMIALSLCLAAAGCGEPSARELKNRQEFEALLTAVSLRDAEELERDARRHDARHAAGDLSDASYDELQEVLRPARAGDWPAAVAHAYAFRDRRPYFR